MNKKNQIRFYIILVSGFFLFLDQYLKYQSINNWTREHLFFKYFGWQPFLNKGVAFGISLPNILTITLTSIIIICIFLILKKESKDLIKFISWILILTGALSNLFDRIYHGFVIDYFAFVTGIINIADVLIVCGLLLYLLWGFVCNKKTS